MAIQASLERKKGIASDDATATDDYLRELRSSDCSWDPVLHYKPCGIGDDSLPLKMDDFFLVLMTKAQRDLLLRFGNSLIAIDATHQLTMHGFLLTTILVVDQDTNSGLPVCFCLSSGVSESFIRPMFDVIKSRLPESFAPTTMISDDDNVCWNVARSVFPTLKNHILCIWHIDKNWRRQCREKIRDQGVRLRVYKELCVLRRIRSVPEFEQALCAFMSSLRDEDAAADFRTYFEKYYIPRKEMWAICYRHCELPGTTAHPEAFHRVLKYVYLHGKRCRRVLLLLRALKRLVKDLVFQYRL
ncbi:hypothetical protein PBRA_002003 [Plasmodiophora brassicae]|uniref:MULE transposase domain-containing protein n=1 Tax=Plasmodiophora brassicae TaxID=37360 RepID=A0A0G4J1K4_PLABS|nr:hypothetical protein PBRA_002003 [Plasmodiophora brassicae]